MSATGDAHFRVSLLHDALLEGRGLPCLPRFNAGLWSPVQSGVLAAGLASRRFLFRDRLVRNTKSQIARKPMDAKPFDEVGEYLLHAVNEAILALNVDTELDFESFLREAGSTPIS